MSDLEHQNQIWLKTDKKKMPFYGPNLAWQTYDLLNLKT